MLGRGIEHIYKKDSSSTSRDENYSVWDEVTGWDWWQI